jgi:hypothetical protein
LPAALAARPEYVLLEGISSVQIPELAAYDELIARPGFSLHRLRQGGGAVPAT